MKRLIDEELGELGCRLAGLPKQNPYALPDPGYFSGLAAELHETVALNRMDEPIPELPKTVPYDVPESYFESLPQSLLQAVHALGKNQKNQPCSVPEDYFSTLPTQLLETAKASGKPAANPKTRPLPTLRRTMPWLAAAAVLSAVWFGIGREQDVPSADLRAETALAKLDADSIGAYVERHVDEFDPETLETSLAGTQVSDFHKAVSGLPNDEIENYLNDAGDGSGALQDM